MANKNNYNYEDIDNPYNNRLLRGSGNGSALDSVLENGLSIDSANEISGNVIGGTSWDNVWISSWIKSRNYMPKKRGFFIEGREGYIECMKLFVGTGGIVGGKIDIPDVTSSSSFHVDSSGNTWWGSNATSFSSAPIKITSAGDITVTGGSITGATITGGLIRTATSNERVEITGNDAYFYDNTTGGGGSITGNVASIFFPRSDNTSKRFVVQKRAGTNSDAENVMEFFYDDLASSGGYNYIFMGIPGDVSSSLKYYTDAYRLETTQLVQIGTNKYPSIGTSEINIATNNAVGSGSTWNSGGTRVLISAKQSTTAADFNFSTGGGGTILGLGLVYNGLPAGATDLKAILDQSGFWMDTDILPQPSTTHNLGSSSNRWEDLYIEDIILSNELVPDTAHTKNIGSSTYPFNDIHADNHYFTRSGYTSKTLSLNTSTEIACNTAFRASGNIYTSGTLNSSGAITGGGTISNSAGDIVCNNGNLQLLKTGVIVAAKDAGGTTRFLTCQFNATLGVYILST